MLVSNLISLLILTAADTDAVHLHKRLLAGHAYTTTGDGVNKLSSIADLTRGPIASTFTGSTWMFNVDDSLAGRKQTITGFGGTITDGTVSLISALGATQQGALINDLFSTGGININLIRHTIGSSDLTAQGQGYTYENGTALKSPFALGPQGTAMLKGMAQIYSVQPALKVLGSSWSAPGWMKLNGLQQGATTNNNMNMNYVTDLAKYFVQYVQAFKAGGVTVDAITVQNEPLNSKAGFPTMYLFPDQEATIVSNLGAALKTAGLPTQIWAYDHNTDNSAYPQQVISTSAGYSNSVAWHCYAASLNWTIMTDFQVKNPSVAQYMTECWTPGPLSTSTIQGSFQQVADFAFGPLDNYAKAVMAWNLASNPTYGPKETSPDACQQCRGIVVIDLSTNSYVKTSDYYVLGQYSKFIPRGAYALKSTGSFDFGGGTKVNGNAFFAADGSRVFVVQSTLTNPVRVQVTFGGDVWNSDVPANSVTTWTIPPVGL